MAKKLLIFIFFLVLVYGVVWGENEYVSDPDHSSISFSIRHMVIGKVRGHFSGFSVTVKEDSADITKSSVTASIRVMAIDTDNKKRDDHLRSGDFFDAAKYPDITFKSKRIEKKGDQYTAVGTFTMRGISKEMVIPFEMSEKITDPWGNTRVGIEAHVKLDRKDYGIKWNKTLDKGGLMVGNQVKVEILLELVQKKK